MMFRRPSAENTFRNSFDSVHVVVPKGVTKRTDLLFSCSSSLWEEQGTGTKQTRRKPTGGIAVRPVQGRERLKGASCEQSRTRCGCIYRKMAPRSSPRSHGR